MKRRITVLARFAIRASLAFALVVCNAPAQTLKITSPASGVIVYPGDTLPVTIDSPDTKFKMVVLVSQQPFGFLPSQSALPVSIAVKIPENACCHKYQFTAAGALPAADGIYSEPITVDVEPAYPPTKLRSESPSLHFESPSGSLPIDLMGEFASGQAFDVTYSSRITYSSTRPEVAQVDYQGIVTPKKPGQASIVVTYTQDASKVRLIVPVTVAVGPVTASAYSIEFPDQAMDSPGVEKAIRLTVNTLGPLKIAKIVAPRDYSETDDCSRELPHGGSCEIHVKFTPHEKGVRTETLTISNDFSGSPLDISLSGTAH